MTSGSPAVALYQRLRSRADLSGWAGLGGHRRLQAPQFWRIDPQASIRPCRRRWRSPPWLGQLRCDLARKLVAGDHGSGCRRASAALRPPRSDGNSVGLGLPDKPGSRPDRYLGRRQHRKSRGAHQPDDQPDRGSDPGGARPNRRGARRGKSLGRKHGRWNTCRESTRRRTRSSRRSRSGRAPSRSPPVRAASGWRCTRERPHRPTDRLRAGGLPDRAAARPGWDGRRLPRDDPA